MKNTENHLLLTIDCILNSSLKKNQQSLEVYSEQYKDMNPYL